MIAVAKVDRVGMEEMSLMSLQEGPTVRLSFEEFRGAVLSPAPHVAVFDCDGTLWSGDAGLGFMTWSMEAGLLSRDASAWIDARHRLYRQGEVSEVTICGEMVQVYAGLRDDELRRAAARYFTAHVEAQIFPEMQSLVADLRVGGTDIWAVSSTNNWVIEEGVRRFGIGPERVLAACVRVKDGLISSDLIDVPTDEGKAEALRRAGIPSPDAVFGNSIHDTAMLEMAKRAFPVNPSPALVEVAAQHGWKIFYPDAVLADHTK
ncbi:MAG: haloacid dehalogenase-like hydrolase [Acidobacteriaceae bacterium]|jgi:phosphoserine phosphatase